MRSIVVHGDTVHPRGLVAEEMAVRSLAVQVTESRGEIGRLLADASTDKPKLSSKTAAVSWASSPRPPHVSVADASRPASAT